MEKMLPLFKKSHIHSRNIEDLLKTGVITGEYVEENNKRNALRQASVLYRIVDGELFRHGTQREYQKYGLRLVIHDDQPDKKAEIIAKCHLDNIGNHLGMNNTIKNVCDTYYWQGISAHVKMYLKQCEQCKNRSKFNAEEWLELERKNIDKKKALAQVSHEAQQELKNLGRVRKPTPPETFFIVNAERKVDLESTEVDAGMMIDSNNIEYVVETLGQSDGIDLDEVCHVMNVPDIVPIPERFRSREIEAFIRDGTYPDDFTSNMKCGLRGPAAQYRIINEELYHEGNKVGSKGLRLVVHDDLPALKVKVMVECHIDEDGSHHGLNKTLNKIGEKYYWTGMSVDVRKFMLHCKICSEQRGRRSMYDAKEYEEEAQQVRSRHLKKMNEEESSGSDMQLTAVPVSYDSTDIEPTEGLEQEGHQVIRLIGPNKEITEITVAVVNQETVTAENTNSNQTIQGSGKDDEYTILAGTVSKGQSLVTKEMTDAVAQIEAAEAAMEMAEFSKQQTIKTEEIEHVELEDQVENSDNNVESNQFVVVKNEVDENRDYTEIENEDMQEDMQEEKNHTDQVAAEETGITVTEKEMTQVEGEMTQIETDEGVVNVLIIKEGEEGQQEKVEGPTRVDREENIETAESGNVVVNPVVQATGEEQTLEEVARQNDSQAMVLPGPTSFHKDLIYVPSIMKTRIIEKFLKIGVGSEGFSHAKLMEMSENFEIVDDVLYRRPSRYKGRQIVIHDDNPELKLKVISEHHLKRNGTHCSELITHQNVAFKYFWEEMKWDIHRWYPTCKVCVNDDGIDRKSNRKILSVAEQKRLIEEKRRENRLSGTTALRSRDFRNKVHHKIHKLSAETLEKYQGQPHIIQISSANMKKMDGSMSQVDVKGLELSNEDSDVEIFIPEGGEDGKARIVTVRKQAEWNVLYDLLIYATLEQEQYIKEMYVRKGWSYNLVSLTKAADEENLDDDEDYFLLTMKVTAIQEKAIKDLFHKMGLAIEASNESKHVGKSTSEKNVQTNSQDLQEKEPVTKKPETIQKQIQEPVPVKKQEIVLKRQEPADQTVEPVVQELEVVDKNDEAENETSETSLQELQKHVKESFAVNQTPIQAPVIPVPVELWKTRDKERPSVAVTLVKTTAVRKTDTTDTPVATKIRKVDTVESLVAQKPGKPGGFVSQSVIPPRKSASMETPETPIAKTTSKTANIESPVKPTTRNTTSIESPGKPEIRKTANVETPVTPAVDKSATKRKINETPVSESRRPRREIKRPRRFSPDSSPPRSVTVKIEPESPKADAEVDETVDDDQADIPIRSRSRGKEPSKSSEVNSSPKKSVQETPKGKSARNTTQNFPKIDVSRNLRSKGEPQKDQNKEIVTENQKSGKEIAKAKISVLSKGRIRVKKVPKEIETHHNSAEPKQKEILQETIGETEKDAEKEDEELTEDKESKQNQQTGIIEEDDVDELDDDDDDDYDDEDYYDDDDDDDDEMDVEESEDMRVPLHIILEDEIESMEAVDVEKGFACSLCDAKFPNKSKCVQHGQKSNCYNKCELCGKLYKKKDQEDYKNHREQHKKSKKFPCTTCKKVFFSDEHLKIHSRSHKKEMLTSCSLCKEKVYTWFQYASHMVHEHGECNMFTCDVCSAKFASINFMKSEIKFDGKLSYFRCIMCNN